MSIVKNSFLPGGIFFIKFIVLVFTATCRIQFRSKNIHLFYIVHLLAKSPMNFMAKQIGLLLIELGIVLDSQVEINMSCILVIMQTRLTAAAMDNVERRNSILANGLVLAHHIQSSFLCDPNVD